VGITRSCALEIGDWNLEIGVWRLEIGDWNLELGNWRLEFGVLKIGIWTSNFQFPASNF
jgi:hypothetical protein